MTEPAYGFAHRARVLRAGQVEGTYLIELPALAPGLASGPFPSTVRDLAPDDSVLVLQMGLTRGDLVIVGRLPERAPDVTLPIGIADVTGLAAALDDRATDAELAALTTATNLNFLVVNNKNTEQDGRLTTAEGTITSNGTRLTTAEGTITSHGTRLTTAEGTISTHTSQISALNQYQQVFQAANEFDVYGDLYSSYPRLWGTNIRTLVQQAAYLWRTRVRVAAAVARVRVMVQAAGTGPGSCTGALYNSSSAAGPYTLAASATNALTSTATQNFTFASPVSVSAGSYIILLIWCGTGYTVNPKIVAFTGSPQVNAGGLNPTIIWGTKLGLAAPPASITITDGTWTAEAAPWWVAAAN